VKEKLEAAGYEVVVTSRESAGGATPMYSARAANATNADAAFEFHFNSAGSTATGSEYLYKAGNDLYRKAAEAMCKTWSAATGLKDRGAMAVCNSSDVDKYKRATSRGVNAFTKANMFFCMTEPFFSSNPEECIKITELFNSGKWSSYMANTIIAACDVLFD
jgi:N-acetylmuramoyl-L-alanine amidase